MDVAIITQPAQVVYGLWGQSGDKTIPKDIPALSNRYYAAIGRSPGSVLPFYVLSRDYDPATGRFDLFIGGHIQGDELAAYTLPAGTYGRIVIRPKLGFLWGAAVGQAKQYFYAKWLPASPYKARGMEYELHTDASVTKKPSVDLLFAISK